MDNIFAKNLLMKYGWSEGKGLGKHENGITQPIKQKLKFDKAGVGHKFEDTSNWWQHCFDAAANRLIVKPDTDGVSISVSSESTKDDINVKESKDSPNYRSFVKTSTLFNGNLITEDKSYVHKEQNIEETLACASLTDKELFKACGGRTAHKGARHGLTLKGKSKRLALQEENLLNVNPRVTWSERLRNDNSSQDDENTTLPIVPTDGESCSYVSRRTKKKVRRRINDLSHRLNISCNLNDSNNKDELAVKEGKEEKLKYKCFNNVQEFPNKQDQVIDLKRKNVSDISIKMIKEDICADLSCKEEKKRKKSSQAETELSCASKIKKFKKFSVDKSNLEKIDCSHNRVKKKKPSKSHKTERTRSTKLHEIRSISVEFVPLTEKKTLGIGMKVKRKKKLTELDKTERTELSKIATEGEIPIYEIGNSTDKSCTESTDSLLKKKIDRLNNKIKKRKRTKKRKTTLDKITATLEDVHISKKELKKDSNKKLKSQ